MRRHIEMLLVAATALTASTAAAQSVQPTRIVAFGDSYADDGNLFQILNIPPPQVYPTGRFSGGTNFIDTLQQLLGARQDNFAIGGAFTGPGNSGFFNINGPGIPGFGFEVDRYLAGGGGPFPTTAPSFGREDLVAVSIGGNDARFYQFNGGTVAGASARAAISVAEATAGLDRLFNAGARNILFLAGNVGDLPEVRGTPIAAVGTAFSQAFNGGIQAPLARYAANGALVHYLDLTLIGNNVRANPAAFGLTSAGACPVACVSNPALQSQYLFYVDQVHLTSAGFDIVGRYALSQIRAPGMLGAATDLGVSSAAAFARTMGGRNELAGNGDAERPLSAFILATTDRHDQAGSSTGLAYDYDDTGVTGGIEYNPGGGPFLGLALSYSGPRARFGGRDAGLAGDAFQAGLYGGYEVGGLDLSATVGYGMIDYRSRRAGVIDTIRGDTEGDNLSVGGEASYLFNVGESFRVGPLVSVDYARASIDGFTEEGDAALTLDVEEQELTSLVGNLGIEAKAELEAGGLSISPYLNATIAKQFDGDGQTVRFAGTYAPTIVNSLTVGERSEDGYGQIEVGASFDLGDRIAFQIQAAGSIEKPGGNEYGGVAGFKFSF